MTMLNIDEVYEQFPAVRKAFDELVIAWHTALNADSEMEQFLAALDGVDEAEDLDVEAEFGAIADAVEAAWKRKRKPMLRLVPQH